MKNKNKFGFINKIITAFVVFSLSGQSVASAQVSQQQDKLRIGYNDATGKVSFIGADPSRPISIRPAQSQGLKPDTRALAMISAYAADFGLRNPISELRLLNTEQVEGRELTRFQQIYKGLPIMGGEIIVNANDQAELLSLSGEISPDLSLDVNPTISAKQAQMTALELMAKSHQVSEDEFEATTPQLWIYDSRLFEANGMKAALVWRLEVNSINNALPINELVLVDAKRGNVVLNFNQIDTAWETTINLKTTHETMRPIKSNTEETPGWIHGFDFHGNQPTDGPNKGVAYSFTSAFTSSVSTYTANNGTTLPGTFLCDQTSPLCTGGVNPDADSAHLFALDVFDYYDIHHNRNSIDNGGMTIISSVQYDSGYQNASWTGTQMRYGDGYSLADDVVAHELTHGVTRYESNLFYYYQSGAINESFSDVWGELYDQQNGLGNDVAGVKWLVAEDIPGGAIRSMSNPPDYGDPDKMTSANYVTANTDNGGVHTNSGINNKAVFLMVDGGSFNGETVTGIGADKTVAIYYEVQTNLLTSGADYSDLYNALYQGCLNLAGGAAGVVSGDCDQVRNATDAVEMNLQPVADFNTDAPLCTVPGEGPNTTFYDRLESGTSNWTIVNGANTNWQYDSPYGNYAHSGTHFLYADDVPAEITDAYVRLKSIIIPPSAFLHFSHAYEFEANDPNYYDGGVLEYSTNNGASWIDAGSLIDYNGYKASIASGFDNPLQGRSAFVGSSHGYISTRVNLSSLAGQSVNFRWRMGLDQNGSYWGWWLDDVRIYNCAITNLDVSINGSSMGVYSIPSNTARQLTYPGTFGGPVRVLNTHSEPVVTSLRLLYLNRFNTNTLSELMGVPTSQLLDNYWMPVYLDDAVMDSQIRFTNTSTTLSTDVSVYIGGVLKGTYTLAPNSATRVRYQGFSGGPVQIVGTPGVPILAGMRIIYAGGNSFDEIMAYPTTQLSNEYWFPFYNHNNVNLDTEIRIGNTDPLLSTDVDVYIGPNLMGTYTIAPNTKQQISYPGVFGGPVRIVGTANVPIVTSLRLLYLNQYSYFTLSELMGVPTAQLLDNYAMPIYLDDTVMDSQVRFTNTSTTLPTTVNVYLGANLMGTYVMPPSSANRIRFTGVSGGPVRIVGTPGVPILAGMRIIYAGGNSFDEIMAYPTTQLSDEYWFPFYNHNNVNLDTEVRIGVP